ncbi:MAG: response regulator transcription factor [Schwartzia sp.]|nr:response regulator transcription factor [Schwartzia sp. (in: firmicutes)]
MRKILIADDNAAIVDILESFAKAEGYETVSAADGEEALSLFQKEHFDAVLLDVMMPKLDGFEVCRAIRRISNVPVLMITARGEDYDRIMGLDIGADDYIVKPFSAKEVMARIRAVLRRLPVSEEKISFGSLSLFPSACRTEINGKEIALTKKEFDLLLLFVQNKGRAFSRDRLLETLWGFDYEGDTRTVDTHIKRLRAKLAKEPHDDWDIRTIWGVGYSFGGET